MYCDYIFMQKHGRVAIWFALLLIARAGGAADSASLAPANWDQGLKLPEAHDRNPDPKIVEIDLNAAERAMFQKSVESVKGLIEACTKIAPHLAG